MRPILSVLKIGTGRRTNTEGCPLWLHDEATKEGSQVASCGAELGSSLLMLMKERTGGDLILIVGRCLGGLLLH